MAEKKSLFDLFRKKEREKYTYDALIDKIDEFSDKFVEKTVKENPAVRYVGGKCIISISENKDKEEEEILAVTMELYGQPVEEDGSDDSWKRTVSKYTISLSEISDDEDTKEKINEIRSQPFEFDIKMPEE